jgi:hypothetical protein
LHCLVAGDQFTIDQQLRRFHGNPLSASWFLAFRRATPYGAATSTQ